MVGKFFMRTSCRAARLSAVFFASFLAAILLTSFQARAQDYWTLSPSQSGDWSNTANWSTGFPTSSGTASIVNGGTANVTTSGDVCGTLLLGGTGSGTVQMIVGRLSLTNNEYVGNSGTAAFAESGGSNTAYYLYLGSNPGISGTYNLSGSGVLSTTLQFVGYYGVGMLTQSGGTNNVYTLYLGYDSGSSGSYNLSGSAMLTAVYEDVGDYSGTAAFTQSGGTNIIAGGKLASGMLFLVRIKPTAYGRATLGAKPFRRAPVRTSIET